MFKGKVVKNIMSLGIIQIANFVIPMISFPIISRIIGPENFGVLQYCQAFVLYFNLFIGYGFNLTATRRLSKNPDDVDLRSKVFSEVFYCQLILFAISVGVLAILTFSIPTLANNRSVAMYSFIFLVSTLFTQNWIFQAMQDLTKIAILNIGGKIVYLTMVLTLVVSSDQFYWQALSLSITQIAVSIISFFWATRAYHIKLIPISLGTCFNLLITERHIFLSQIFNSMYVTFNVILLGFVLSALDVGYYTAAQRLITICIQLFSMPLAQILFPIIGRSFGKGKEVGIEKAQKVIPLVFFFSLILSLLLFFSSGFVLVVFYGDSFAPSISVFKYLAFVPFFAIMNNMIGVQFLINLGKDRLYLRVMVIAMIFSLFTNYLLTSWMGVSGAGFTWLITEVLIFALLYQVSKSINIAVFNFKFFNIRFVANMLYNIIK